MPDPTSRRRRRFWAIPLTVVFACVGAGVLLVVAYSATLVPELPRLRDVQNPEVALATVAFAADGTELARYYRQNRTWVRYDHISPHVLDALLATEDHRFFRHEGVDTRRLVASVWKTLRGDRQGGSTITMQLARNLFPEVGTDASLDRKLKEIMTAHKLERQYEKHEILEMYLNTVPFGYNAFGIEAAAQTYFGRSARRLGVLEAATLVGMLKATTRYNPVRNPELAQQRRNVALGQLHKRGKLSAGQVGALKAAPLRLDFQTTTRAEGPAPHFAEHVRGWLEDWGERAGYDVYEDGLRVYTTLDPGLQRLASQAVQRQMAGLQAVAAYEWSRPAPGTLADDAGVYERYQREGRFEPFGYLWRTRTDFVDSHIRRTARYRARVGAGEAQDAAVAALRRDGAFMDSLKTAVTRLEVGFVVLDPATGHVKAWVGGRDFGVDQYDKVALARRQPGSTFKPFVYATAVDFGYSPYHVMRDSAATYRLAGSGDVWQPRNAGGGASGAEVTLRDALTYSKNTITARLMSELGPNPVANLAHRMGVASELKRVPSLGLGTSEVTLLEMAHAYATFAAAGTRRAPVVVTRIEDADGRVLYQAPGRAEKALSMYTAYTTLDMMRGVVDRGTAARLRSQFGVRGDVAGKTGTTQHSADGWFIAMHPRLVAGAWVGFNDRRLAFRTSDWGQGGRNALLIVGDFLRAAQEADPAMAAARFVPPPGYRPPEPPPPPSEDDFYYDYAGYDVDLDSDARNAFQEGLDRRPPRALADDADPEAALRRATADSAAVPPPPPPARLPLAQEADAETTLREAAPPPEVEAVKLVPATVLPPASGPAPDTTGTQR